MIVPSCVGWQQLSQRVTWGVTNTWQHHHVARLLLPLLLLQLPLLSLLV